MTSASAHEPAPSGHLLTLPQRARLRPVEPSAFLVARQSLAADRSRGRDFVSSWNRALKLARETDPGPGHRKEWGDELAALTATRTEWLLAFERRSQDPVTRALVTAAE